VTGAEAVEPDHERTDSAHHHTSHRALLSDTPTIRYPAQVDAIVVPTARNVSALKPAIAAAAKLDATLVVLCSKWSAAAEVLRLREARNVKLITIDVSRLPAGVIPKFKTCEVLAGTKFKRRTDTSLKRNLGLLLARLIGWKRIVFLDDDIVLPEPLDLEDAAGLTDRYSGVGLAIDGMPDNSVVCHAFREAGGAQDMFLGGGALAVGEQAMTSFFPNVYNEDWFFLLDDTGLRPSTTTGSAVQKPYDPFAQEDRARMEELGDCLAEGLFWLLDNGKSIEDADARHWAHFLAERRSFITEVIGMVSRMGGDPERRGRMLLSLKAARGRCHLISPDLCNRFVNAWLADRFTWRRHLDNAFKTHVARKGLQRKDRRSLSGVRQLLCSLGLPESSFHLSLPSEALEQDAADLDVSMSMAVGE
jgi:hypothetical protein